MPRAGSDNLVLPFALLAIIQSGCGFFSFDSPKLDDNATGGEAGQRQAGFDSVHHFADWPMPNALSDEFPNQERYLLQGDVVLDLVTHLQWQASASPKRLLWQEAKDYCTAASSGGYGDWYFPSRIELVSIMSFDAATPTLIDTTAFPDSPNDYFWSASPYASPDTPAYAWAISFTANGYFAYSTIATEGEPSPVRYARCVRRTDPIADGDRPSYQTVDATSVRDLGTGLYWQLAVTKDVKWVDAGAACQALGDGWRLPTVKELQTLFDETIPHYGVGEWTDGDLPSVKSGFASTLVGHFWSASLVSGYQLAWWVDLGNGRVDHAAGGVDAISPSSTETASARCVR